MRGRNFQLPGFGRRDRAAEGDDVVGNILDVLLGLLRFAERGSREAITAEGRALQVVELAVGAEIEAQLDRHDFADVNAFVANDDLAEIRRGLTRVGAGNRAARSGLGLGLTWRALLLLALLLLHRRRREHLLHAPGAGRRRKSASGTADAQTHGRRAHLASIHLHGKAGNGEAAGAIRDDRVGINGHRRGLHVDDLGALRFSGQADLEAVHSERARHVTRAAQIDELVLQLQRHADLPGLGADRGVDLRAGGGQGAEQKHRGGEKSGSNVHWSNHLTSL